MAKKKILNIGGKIIPLEICELTKEVKIMVGEDEKKKSKEEEKKASTCWTRAKLLEMIAWYLIPVIYILFTVAYFIIYSMF